MLRVRDGVGSLGTYKHDVTFNNQLSTFVRATLNNPSTPTGAGTVQFTGTYTHRPAPNGRCSVSYQIDGGPFIDVVSATAPTAPAPPCGYFYGSIDTRMLPKGQHVLKVRIVDALGDVGEVSRTMTYSNTTLLPYVNFVNLTPAPNAALTGSVTIGGTYNYRRQLPGEPLLPAQVCVLTYRIDNGPEKTPANPTNCGNINIGFDTRSVPSGKHTIYLKVVDPAGDVGTAFIPVSIKN